MDGTGPDRSPSQVNQSQDYGIVATRNPPGVMLAALGSYMGLTFLNIISLYLRA